MTGPDQSKVQNFLVTSQGVSATRWLAFVLGSHPKVFVAHGHFPLDSVATGAFDKEQAKGDEESLAIGSLSNEFYQRAGLDEIFETYRKIRPDAEAVGNVHSFTLDGLLQRFPPPDAIDGYAIANVIRHPVTFIESHNRLVRKAEQYPAIYDGYVNYMFPTAVRSVPELLFVDCPDYREFFAFVVSCQSVLHVARDLSHDNFRHFQMEALTSDPARLKGFCDELTGQDYPIDQLTSFIEKGPINRHRAAKEKTDAAAIFADWPTWKRDVISLMLADATLVRFEGAGYDMSMLREPHEPKVSEPRTATPCLADALRAIDENHPLLKEFVSAPDAGPIEPARVDVELVEAHAGFNLVRAGDIFYALRQSAGEINVLDGPSVLIERHGPSNVIISDSLDGARARIDLLLLSQRIDGIEAARAREIEASRSREAETARIEKIEAALAREIEAARAREIEAARAKEVEAAMNKEIGEIGTFVLGTQAELTQLRADVGVSKAVTDNWRQITARQILASAESSGSEPESLASRVLGKRVSPRANTHELELIRNAKLFSPAWYLQRYPDIAASTIDPLLHYVLHGAAEGRDPHPLFDTVFYRRSYPPDFKMSPLAHYIWLGVPEGCDPHPLFDTDWYLRENPGVAFAHCNPLLHYMEVGAWEGRDPHPLFDSSWYIERNPAISANHENPLVHYVTVGFREGCNPNPDFDGSQYYAQHPQVAASGENPLIHYVLTGRGQD